MFKFPNPMDELLKQIEASNRRLIDSVSRQFQDQANKLAQPIELKLPTIEFSSLAESMIRESTRGIEEAIKRFNLILAKASSIMARHGWWIIRQFSIGYYKDVANRDENVTREALNNDILSWFRRNEWEPLTKMVNGWTLNGFSTRIRHFQDALEVHKQGRYTMSVPGLVIHIEGIIREFIQATEDFTDSNFWSIRNRFCEKFKRVTDLPEDHEPDVDDVQALENYYNLRVIESLYQNYRPEQHQAPDGISRHAIGHGLWIDYDTEEGSLYLFLLLDMVHAMLEQLESDSW